MDADDADDADWDGRVAMEARGLTLVVMQRRREQRRACWRFVFDLDSGLALIRVFP